MYSTDSRPIVEPSQTSNPVCKVCLCRAGILSHSWARAICSSGLGPAVAALSLVQFQDAGRPSAPFTDKGESCVLLHGELTGKQRLDLEPCRTVWFLAERIQAFCRAATAFRKIALLWVNQQASICREELLFWCQTQVARELCLPSELVEAFMGFWVRPLPQRAGWDRDAPKQMTRIYHCKNNALREKKEEKQNALIKHQSKHTWLLNKKPNLAVEILPQKLFPSS